MRKARLIYFGEPSDGGAGGVSRKMARQQKLAKCNLSRWFKTSASVKSPNSYKRTPSAALGSIPPLDCDIYTETTALQRAASTADHPVYKDIPKQHSGRCLADEGSETWHSQAKRASP
jgi:hypothetical protein